MSPQKGKMQGEHDSDIEASPRWNAGPGKGGTIAATGDPLANWFENHFTALEDQGESSTGSCNPLLCFAVFGKPSIPRQVHCLGLKVLEPSLFYCHEMV